MPAAPFLAEPASLHASRGCPLETCMRRAAASFARAAAETAEAFFSSPAAAATAWEAPRLPEGRALYCSQRNIGERYELLLNLAADKSEFGALFPAEVPEAIRMDAYCELANCICGTLLADEGFAGEFGSLIPCVPCSSSGRVTAGARAFRGAFRLRGAWIRYSFSVQETAPGQSALARYAAAA